ncbi:MAG: GNAT family N-acetyltransferase, partial [Jiangellaceae bacterium]
LEPALDQLVRRPTVVELVPLGADDVGLRRQVVQLRPRPDQEKYSGRAAETLPAAEVDPGRTPFAIVHGGGAVGFGVLDREGTLAEITDDPAGAVLLRGFYLDAAAQGLGLGRAAVAALPGLAATVAPGASRMLLTVNVENPRAVRAYLSGGFLDTGREYLGGLAGPQHVFALPLRQA